MFYVFTAKVNTCINFLLYYGPMTHVTSLVLPLIRDSDETQTFQSCILPLAALNFLCLCSDYRKHWRIGCVTRVSNMWVGCFRTTNDKTVLFLAPWLEVSMAPCWIDSYLLIGRILGSWTLQYFSTTILALLQDRLECISRISISKLAQCSTIIIPIQFYDMLIYKNMHNEYLTTSLLVDEAITKNFMDTNYGRLDPRLNESRAAKAHQGERLGQI